MAINYAAKYSPVVDDAFRLGSLTQAAFGAKYDFEGVKTVNIYSNGTSALNDYKMSGSDRYGTPDELANAVQTVTISQDKSFTYTIDRANYDDTMMTIEAGKSLRDELDLVVIPNRDAYNLSVLVSGAGTTATAVTPTKSNAYSLFLEGTKTLGNNKVPAVGRIAFVSYDYYNLIKQDSSFVKSGDVSQNMLVTGSVGMIDGVNVIPIPDSYLPANVYLILTHPMAAAAPEKLAEYKTHTDAPGISGWLIEGRVRYDAFVLDQKKMAIYVQGKAAA